MSVTEAEELLLKIVRLNSTRQIVGISKLVTVGRLRITFQWRSAKNPMGRFGGGWNWKLGFMAGGGTAIFSLLVCDLRFDFTRKQKDPRHDR